MQGSGHHHHDNSMMTERPVVTVSVFVSPFPPLQSVLMAGVSPPSHPPLSYATAIECFILQRFKQINNYTYTIHPIEADGLYSGLSVSVE